jgi:hypothetical protein
MAIPPGRRKNKDLNRAFGRSATPTSVTDQAKWDDESYDVQLLVGPNGEVHVVLDPNPFVAEDSVGVAGQLMLPVAYLRNDNDAVLTSNDGDVSWLSVDSAGRAKIRPLTKVLDEVRAVPERPSERPGATKCTGQAIWANGQAAQAFVMTPAQPGGKVLYIESIAICALDDTGTTAANLATSVTVFRTGGTRIISIAVPPPVLAVLGLGGLVGIAQSGVANEFTPFPEPALSTAPPTLGAGPLGAAAGPTTAIAEIEGYWGDP